MRALVTPFFIAVLPVVSSCSIAKRPTLPASTHGVTTSRARPAGVATRVKLDVRTTDSWEAVLKVDGRELSRFTVANEPGQLDMPFGVHDLTLDVRTYTVTTTTTMQTRTVYVSQTQMVPCSGYNYSTLCAQTTQVPQTQTVPVTQEAEPFAPTPKGATRSR